MKKLLALLLAILVATSLVACNNTPAETTGTNNPVVSTDPLTDNPEQDTPADVDAVLTEEEAAAARDAGTLTGDAYAGYDYSDSTGLWYYSNYPNYKDFNADGKIKVAYVCKYCDTWFTPKDRTLGETVKAAGYEYLFIDANSDEQQWLDGVQNAINQDFDIVVLTPVNTALLPDAITMLQEAGIAYMTADDPGADNYDFYVPHYGLDDKYLYYELGKAAADKMVKENFFDGVAEDYSNFKFIILDSPAIEAIHDRNLGVEQAILETYPDIPESSIVWVDCGGGLIDDVSTKLSSVLQANLATTDKWVFASGTGNAILGSFTLLEENGIKAEDFIMIEAINDMAIGELMLVHEYASSCVLVGLASAPSGVGMGKLIIDLVENGTPIPCFTGYELIVVDKESAPDFIEQYLS